MSAGASAGYSQCNHTGECASTQACIVVLMSAGARRDRPGLVLRLICYACIVERQKVTEASYTCVQPSQTCSSLFRMGQRQRQSDLEG
jgi:hypothetical protein